MTYFYLFLLFVANLWRLFISEFIVSVINILHFIIDDRFLNIVYLLEQTSIVPHSITSNKSKDNFIYIHTPAIWEWFLPPRPSNDGWRWVNDLSYDIFQSIECSPARQDWGLKWPHSLERVLWLDGRNTSSVKACFVAVWWRNVSVVNMEEREALKRQIELLQSKCPCTLHFVLFGSTQLSEAFFELLVYQMS